MPPAASGPRFWTVKVCIVIGFGDHDLSEPRHLEHIVGTVADIECDPLGRFVAARHEDGKIRLWDLDGDEPPRVIEGPPKFTVHRITSDGSLLEADRSENGEAETWIWSLETEQPTLLRHINLGKAGGTGLWRLNPVERQIVSILNPDPKIRLWPLRVPPDAEPVIMQRGDIGVLFRLDIHPKGQWLATSASNGLTFWPIARPYPTVIKRYEERVASLAFGPEGRWLATSDLSRRGIVRRWQLEGDNLPPAQIVYEAGTHAYGVAASPDGEKILLGTHGKGTQLLSLDGEAPRRLPGDLHGSWGVAFSLDGQFAAATVVAEDGVTREVRVWDLVSFEEVAAMDLGDVIFTGFLRFTEGGQLLVGNASGLVSWDIETGDSEALFEGPIFDFAMSSDEARVLLSEADGEMKNFYLA